MPKARKPAVGSSEYVKAKDVRSPRNRVTGDPKIIYDSGRRDGIAVACVVFDGEPEICVRWNGAKEYPFGYLNSRGQATWHVVGPELGPAVEEAARKIAAGGSVHVKS